MRRNSDNICRSAADESSLPSGLAIRGNRRRLVAWPLKIVVAVVIAVDSIVETNSEKLATALLGMFGFAGRAARLSVGLGWVHGRGLSAEECGS